MLDRAITNAHKTSRKEDVRTRKSTFAEYGRGVLKKLSGQGIIVGPVNLETVQMLAVEYEFRVNPVWPMPGLRRTLVSLQRVGMVLGIVSNAQFYTPHMLESFPETGWSARWFDTDACVWSYRLREAKPSPRLFAKALKQLQARHGIRPGEVLCVGNDMLNDILPAVRAGCRTALFAGDPHSYRPRETEFADRGRTSDVVISALVQLGQVVASGRRR